LEEQINAAVSETSGTMNVPTHLLQKLSTQIGEFNKMFETMEKKTWVTWKLASKLWKLA
jgi:hypothetical protein